MSLIKAEWESPSQLLTELRRAKEMSLPRLMKTDDDPTLGYRGRPRLHSAFERLTDTVRCLCASRMSGPRSIRGEIHPPNQPHAKPGVSVVMEQRDGH